MALAFGLVAMGATAMVTSPGWFPTDANTYRAAAERLNDGHFLYRLLPGDRPMTLSPPQITVPILSPPPIAVAWRPLALLGDPSLLVWWAGCAVAIFTALGLLARKRPVATSLAMLALSLPLTFSLGWSNVDGYFLLAMVGAWLAARSGRDWLAGILVATLIAIKLTPLPLALWLLVTGRLRAFGAVAVAGLAWLAVSVAGAGLDAHFEYLAVIRNTLGPGTSDLSLAGLGRWAGLPAAVAGALPYVWWLACGAAMVAFRRAPGRAWIAAVLMQVFGSPVVQPYTLILLLPILAPGAWPWEMRPDGRQAAARHSGPGAESSVAGRATVPLTGSTGTGSAGVSPTSGADS